MYHVKATREGKFWHIYVPEIDRVTQARKYSEIEEMARDLIEIMTGDSDPSLSIKVDLPAKVRVHLDRAEKLRVEEATARKQAAAESRAAVRQLVDEGMSQREAADVLGISFQRVNQLVRS